MDKPKVRQRALRSHQQGYELRENYTAKSDLWHSFGLIYKDGEEIVALCACRKCYTVLQYRNKDGESTGASTLKKHLTSCPKNPPKGQRLYTSTVPQPVQFSIEERDCVKKACVLFVAFEHHSFGSTESEGLRGLCQKFVDLANKKHKNFDVNSIFPGRKVVSQEAQSMAIELKEKLKIVLKEFMKSKAVAVTVDLATDDLMKSSYLDVHAIWITSDYILMSCPIGIKHFGVEAHTGDNIFTAFSDISDSYELDLAQLGITTDCGSNVKRAFSRNMRLNCLYHRLHTVVSTTWTQTISGCEQSKTYEEGINSLCAFIKSSTGIQEQLPLTLKFGANTRAWTSLYQRSLSVHTSSEKLREILSLRHRVSLICAVDLQLNEQFMQFTEQLTSYFKALEVGNTPSLQNVCPSYYALARLCRTSIGDHAVITILKEQFLVALDSKFWSSIVALHWMASFLDPSLKSLIFLPVETSVDREFKIRTEADIETWVKTEMNRVISDEEQMLVSHDDEQDDQPSTSSGSSARSEQNPCDIFSHFRSGAAEPPTISSTTTSVSRSQAVDREFSLYKSADIRLHNEQIKDPLIFWRSAADFSILRKVARRIFVLSASSAPSERDFSSLNLTITDRRARLNPDTVEALELIT